jgi:hypothetical protein
MNPPQGNLPYCQHGMIFSVDRRARNEKKSKTGLFSFLASVRMLRGVHYRRGGDELL